MSEARFLHVADVHLDSPLSHLRRLDEQAARRLQNASRQSLETIVQTALEEQVAAVVIAGDLFDGPVKDAGAGLWANSQLRKLTKSGIDVCLIRGNHDAMSNAHKATVWSDGIIEFSAESPETHIVENAAIAIHGQSFGARSESRDLAQNYPDPVRGCYNLGLLHTSLSGASAQHDTYAPTSVGVLENKGYDYWALGHIHARSEESLSERCYIGYSGNTQGRHIREPGIKGCQLVTLRDGQLDSTRLISTDSVRWFEVVVDATDLDHLADIEDVVERQVGELLTNAGDRALAIRVRVEGYSRLHKELVQPAVQERLTDTLSGMVRELGEVWLERLRVSTRVGNHTDSGVQDLDLPLKYLAHVAEDFREDNGLRDELKSELEELLRKTRGELSEINWPLTNERHCETELNATVEAAHQSVLAQLLDGSAANDD